MGLVCTYVKKIDWSLDWPLDLVEVKLQRLNTELLHIMYVSITFLLLHIDKLSVILMWICRDQHVMPILPRSFAALTTVSKHNCHSNARQWKISILTKNESKGPHLRTRLHPIHHQRPVLNRPIRPLQDPRNLAQLPAHRKSTAFL